MIADEQDIGAQLEDIAVGLERIVDQISGLQDGSARQTVVGTESTVELSDAFKLSVQLAARPGLQLND